MFAVPGGWTLSTAKLKTQTSANSDADGLVNAIAENEPPKRKKRKRGHGDKNIAVTGENLGELWKRYCENEAVGKEKKGLNRGDEAINIRQDEAGRRDEEKTIVASKNTVQHGSSLAETNDQKKAFDHLPDDDALPKKEESLEQPEHPKEQDDGRAKYERRKAKAERRREQRAQKQANGELPPTRVEAGPGEASASIEKAQKRPKSKKQNNKSNSASTTIQPNNDTNATTDSSPITAPNPTTTTTVAPPSKPNLTPLQSKMASKLTSARFRHLNETLYTTASSAALALFTANPSAYTAYHAGFRAQVAVWPSNPIESFIADIGARAAVTDYSKRGSQAKAFRKFKQQQQSLTKKPDPSPPANNPSPNGHHPQQQQQQQQTPPSPLLPLPQNPTTAKTIIADLGCGDAHLATHFSPPHPLAPNLHILSFDLHPGTAAPPATTITVADITNLRPAGIAPGSVDIALCCLSLMSTNWVRIVAECARIVRRGRGEAWVAEIRSRFAGSGGGRGGGKMTTMMDKDRTKKKMRKKGKEGQSEERVDSPPLALLDELDGDERLAGKERVREKEDFAPFIAVWQRRGFSLAPGGVNAGNKMFVTMRFVRDRRDGGVDGGDGGEEEEDDDEVKEREEEEGKVLKPCLYKTR